MNVNVAPQSVLTQGLAAPQTREQILARAEAMVPILAQRSQECN